MNKKPQNRYHYGNHKIDTIMAHHRQKNKVTAGEVKAKAPKLSKRAKNKLKQQQAERRDKQRKNTRKNKPTVPKRARVW